MNPWLTIPLEDYEGHMKMPSVKQTELVSSQLRESVNRFNPKSICYVGCAGGAGLEHVDSGIEVCGFDINPSYVESARGRYGDKFKESIFLEHDIHQEFPLERKYDLVYVALVLEYLDLEKGLPNITRLVNGGGVLSVLLQLKSEKTDSISRTPYEKIYNLEGLFRHVNSEEVKEKLVDLNFNEIVRNNVVLESGKKFLSISFENGSNRPN